jgi:hypothetical protein
MSLFTSTGRETVAYFLAVFFLLGRLASPHNLGVLAAISNEQRSEAASESARSIAQDNAEFSWDTVRINVDFFNCISIVDLTTIASACKRT